MLVNSHLQAPQALASGIHAVPGVREAFAATQGAYRFFNNPRVSLSALAEPLIDMARIEMIDQCSKFGLVIHDWSQLMYPEHASKKERATLSSRKRPEGYKLQTALLVSDRDGIPLAPLVMSLQAADGVHCSRSEAVRPAESPLDELEPTMRYVEGLSWNHPLVHIIDAEADSVAHYREWATCPDRLFLVRADDRVVEWEGIEQKCSAIRETLQTRGKLQYTRDVMYHGKKVQQYVVEADVRLLRAGQRNRPNSNDRRRIPGPPLPLRLVIAEIRDDADKVLATWWLLTNVSPTQADASTVALWYYWRWSIESFYKLLKSAGMQVEQWQQETPHAIAARLLVASMACVTVWRLAHSTHSQADAARRLLVRLSGRQMKRSRPFTLPALLAGMWTLLAMLNILQTHSLQELQELAQIALPRPRGP